MPPTIWLFEDQLSLDLEPLNRSKDAAVLLIESDRNMRRLPYHRKRLVFLVSAMRHFVQELQSSGREVAHYPLQKTGYRDSLSALRHYVRKTGCNEFWIIEPSEYHTRKWLESLTDQLGIKITYFPNTLFLTDRHEFRQWVQGIKSPVMEHFYRKMRVKHDVLMDGDKPVGGKWNLDHENRKPIRGQVDIPRRMTFPPDGITQQVIQEIDRRFSDHYGTTDGFDLPVTRSDARIFFDDFLDHRLAGFGDYEDAMLTDEPVLFHSMISPLINVGLLDPLECVRAAEDRWRQNKAPLNAVEGFVRQILGWREYVYGIYWSFMPEYRDRNSRGSERKLPDFFWNADTDLNCLKQCLRQVVKHAYTHHIQRLMVLCNFATLTGISPQAVNDWFLTMYVDSHDWVVTPNVIGMGMNADGGTMATKPYVSSAAYINRMSDYCQKCRYDPKSRTGKNACPFNYLYWTFLRHFRESLGKNMRMNMILKNLDRIPQNEMRQMMQHRKQFIESL
ncbi:MAG: cryptochrome/photolyase family protein [Phycisphaerae bacterium]|nr:MAG: cryptochrome/photolyase family protein [Phycisphaerae bacterium]